MMDRGKSKEGAFKRILMGKRFATRFVYIARETRSFIAYCTEPDTLLRSIKTALIVGTILVLINHGSEVLSGQFAWNWAIPALVTYLVPFSVPTYGQAQGKRQRDRLRTTGSSRRQHEQSPSQKRQGEHG